MIGECRGRSDKWQVASGSAEAHLPAGSLAPLGTPHYSAFRIWHSSLRIHETGTPNAVATLNPREVGGGQLDVVRGRKEPNLMKMLFFSADRMEVQTVSKAFNDAGIACETRESGLGRALFPAPGEAELWIQHDQDAYKALLLCVEQGIGFARRPPNSEAAVTYPSWDLDEPQTQTDEEPEKHEAEK